MTGASGLSAKAQRHLDALRLRSKVTVVLLVAFGSWIGMSMAMPVASSKYDFMMRVVLYVPLLIAWSSWLFRAYRNVEEVFGLTTKRSGLRAVLYHYIPFINLLKPYEVFVEMWTLIAPPHRQRERALLMGWWGVWLLSQLYYGANMKLSAMWPEPWAQGFLTLLDVMLFPCSCLLAAKVILSITAFQSSLWNVKAVSEVLD